MHRRKAVRLAIRLVILGTAAGTLAGYGAYTVRPSRALPADTAGSARALAEPQMANRLAKADRLAVLADAAPAANRGAGYSLASYSLASATPGIGLDRFYDMVNGVAPPAGEAEPAPGDVTGTVNTADEVRDRTAVAAIPLPMPRPKNLLPPPPSGMLDDNQIAGLKGRLRLTQDQAQYWPAVETALRTVVRTHLRQGRLTPNPRGRVNIDVNSPEVQQLIWAAMPLIMRLRDDQKREVRKLARVMGLESVASQI